MLLKITTTHKPATDLGFLLHKHPDRLQSVEFSAGKAHIFYPEACAEKCTAALLLDIDSVEMVNKARNTAAEFSLGHYVNDRPYVASSFMSVAIAKAFSSALNGNCAKKPELADLIMPLEVTVSVVAAPKGGELLIRKLFEPLGYEVELKRHQLDENFPEWGQSKYFTLMLKAEKRLQDLLKHLYVLMPVLDNEKHYWVSKHEVEKLLDKGEGWLSSHPEKEQIVHRYLKEFRGLSRNALERLTKEEGAEDDAGEEPEEITRKKVSLHQKRLALVLEELKASGAKRILDLGCGEGKLLKLLLKEKQFEYMLGVDVSIRELEKASDKLHLRELSPRQKDRIDLIQGALTYKDKRLSGFDAAAIVEVIEHLDLNRLKAFERVVFEFARPAAIVLTTPNKEYNQLFEGMVKDAFRHSDHRFEWTRAEFESWATEVASKNGYVVKFKSVGEEEPQVGAPSQMAVFNRLED